MEFVKFMGREINNAFQRHSIGRDKVTRADDNKSIIIIRTFWWKLAWGCTSVDFKVERLWYPIGGYDRVIYFVSPLCSPKLLLCRPADGADNIFFLSVSQIYSAPGKCCRNITRNNTRCICKKNMQWNYNERAFNSCSWLATRRDVTRNFLYFFTPTVFCRQSFRFHPKYTPIIRSMRRYWRATRPIVSLSRTNSHALGEMSKEHGER